MRTETIQKVSRFAAIKQTTVKLLTWSVGYYFIRFMVISKGSIISFLLVDVGYFVVLLAHLLIIFRGVKNYGDDNPTFSLGQGISIGCISSVIAKMISFLMMVIIGDIFFAEASAALNTVSFLTFPFALLFAIFFGALAGGLSGVFVR